MENVTTQTPLKLLVVDDEKIVRHTVSGFLSRLGHEVDCADNGAQGLEMVRSGAYDLAFVDIRMPELDGMQFLEATREHAPNLSVILISGHGNMDTVVEALRLGATDYLSKPIRLRELEAAVEKAARMRDLATREERLRQTLADIQRGEGGLECRGFVGASPDARRVREAIETAARAKCDTVLVLGETGTGKEVVARCLHGRRSGPEAPFIAVNCPALPETLAESELFGHVRGAFTGADEDRAGCFELADGGTLFLDEIGELNDTMQAKLLRALEMRTVRRIGDRKEIAVNTCIVAATNRDLALEMAEGRFREDLFYRLNVFTIQVPPLRKRRDDVLPLAEHFLESYAGARGIAPATLSEKARHRLVEYDFPGNARELRNILERAAILSAGQQIEAMHLALESVSAPAPTEAAPPAVNDEARRILEALEKCRWNRRQAAKDLDMPYSTLRYKIDRYGLR